MMYPGPTLRDQDWAAAEERYEAAFTAPTPRKVDTRKRVGTAYGAAGVRERATAVHALSKLLRVHHRETPAASASENLQSK
jgi:hypothetical protein